jgi:hypothetical protein
MTSSFRNNVARDAGRHCYSGARQSTPSIGSESCAEVGDSVSLGSTLGPQKDAMLPTGKRGNTRVSRFLPGTSGLPCDLLLLAGERFDGDGSFVTVTLLQSPPISSNIGPEFFCQADVFGQPQCVPNHDIGRGKAACGERLRLAGRGFYRS